MAHPVMIVDDEPVLRDTISRIIQRGGFETLTVSSGNECLEELRKGFQGLVLMDVSMPEMDGWATVGEIVKQGFSEKVIICMLTGKSEPDNGMEPVKEYVLDYITKPVQSKDLLQLLNEYSTYLE